MFKNSLHVPPRSDKHDATALRCLFVRCSFGQELNVVNVSVVDVRVEHEVKLTDFTKRPERSGGSPPEVR